MKTKLGKNGKAKGISTINQNYQRQIIQMDITTETQKPKEGNNRKRINVDINRLRKILKILKPTNQ